MLLLSWVIAPVLALDAHGFVFDGMTGEVTDYARMGYPTAGVFGETDISLVLDYARDPLTEITPDGRVPVVTGLGTMTLSGAFSFGELRLEAGLPYHPIGEDPSGSFSVPGDARFGAMVPVPFLGPKAPLIGVHVGVVIPTGSEAHYVSAGSVRFQGSVLAAREFGPVGLIAMAGGVVSRPEEDRNLAGGAGPMFGLGASYRVDERFSAAVELTGESEFGFSSLPMEATLSGRYRLPVGAWVTAGGAAGVTGGVGASRWRVFTGLGWTFGREELEMEVAEVEDTSDRDQDTILDRLDACPDQAETVDGFADSDGCPELDGDQDGVPFVRDSCPSQPIRPEQDPRYSDGCPRLAEMAGDRITISEAIYFAEGKAELLPSSEHVLQAVYDLLSEHPEVGPLLVSGHSNSNGSDSYNLRLSDARAFEVMNWLVNKGIDPSRLFSKGYGESIPLVADSDPRAESINRRVEFHVLPSIAPDGARQVVLPPDVLAARQAAAAKAKADAAAKAKAEAAGDAEASSVVEMPVASEPTEVPQEVPVRVMTPPPPKRRSADESDHH